MKLQSDRHLQSSASSFSLNVQLSIYEILSLQADTPSVHCFFPSLQLLELQLLIQLVEGLEGGNFASYRWEIHSMASNTDTHLDGLMVSTG